MTDLFFKYFDHCLLIEMISFVFPGMEVYSFKHMTLRKDPWASLDWGAGPGHKKG